MSSLFISAFLLFAIQPMFAKMVLPKLGGSPAVWSVAMCFFQAMLLAGYTYAHGLIRLVSLKQGILVHCIVLFMACVVLPIQVVQGWDIPPEEGVQFWVIGLFVLSIGLPFFALSGNGPLLQAWFSKTDHAHASDPYFLYGASNFGSLLALLSYPFLIEPSFALSSQGVFWSFGYLVLIGSVIGSAVLLWCARAQPQALNVNDVQNNVVGSVSWADRLYWIGLTFVPSALLIAVTNNITTDIAAGPFIWIIPLSLYLVTYIITFQRQPVLPHGLMVGLLPFAVVLLLFTVLFPVASYWLVFLIIHLSAFFIMTMVCHGRLVQLRPASSQLTEFYLWMSFGGMLGGVFASLIAPQIFSSHVEYPLMIVLATLALGRLPKLNIEGYYKIIPVVGFVLLVVTLISLPGELYDINLTKVPKAYILISLFLLVAVIITRKNTVWFAGMVAATFLASSQMLATSDKESYRGFFGVNYVSVTPDKKHRLLTHGTTLHGAQRLDGQNPPEPLTYYQRQGPFADSLRLLREGQKLNRVGVVGLGAGSLACYKQPHEKWTFFEIDPLVVKIARDPSKFTFLSSCAPRSEIITGDARITLKQDPHSDYDFLIIDAFSSDVVPVHLLTIEAIQEFMQKLNEDGVLLLHISNRNMDLAPVVSALANKLNLIGMLGNLKQTKKITSDYKTGAKVAVLTRKKENIQNFKTNKVWQPLPEPIDTVWTDDYSDIFSLILAKLF